VTDGTLVWASFGTHGLAAFDFSGKIVWHKDLGDLSNYHGSAGSPVLYKDKIFLYQDHDGTASLRSFVAAFNAKTGDIVWKKDRVETVGWGTPIVINTGERDELVVSSQRRIYAYNPETGEELWTVRGNTFEVIPTPVVGHGLVFVSSGRAGPTFAVKPGGKGDVTTTHVAWTSPKGSPFVPSGLVHGDLLYLVNDMQSILTVFHAKTGELAYQDRLGQPVREGFSSSPVAIGNKLFFTNDDGRTFVIEAGPVFKLLRTNDMGARVLASPALVDGVWYWRTDRELIAIQ
jgi:outer membrane protein assembly factor BamB